MTPAGPLERKWMLLEFFLGLLPVTLLAFAGGILALFVSPWFLLALVADVAKFAAGQSSLDLDVLRMGYPVLLALGGLVGTFCLWALYFSRFRGFAEFTNMRLISYGVWAGVLASFGFGILSANPGDAWTATIPSPIYLFANLTAIRLWWVTRAEV